ncbi:SMU1112c/YaeR family gloxylase I-like metalloprotein [Thalassotalea hakodatensis]|uniref:SMU1112c/YaeR family gloxylase I-like metalloprotein n=1 Tax=Thalassotalea hakodatensis TaxID=3030492 RepID=UPI0025729A50|nr:VOC family protein [Thalassotalea hakodatensis]
MNNKIVLKGIHHVAIICADYQRTKAFYVDILGLEIIAENYRAERQSYKLDLALPDGSQLEIFSFANAPKRPSYPEAQGLRHLAFRVDSVEQTALLLTKKGIEVEPIRVDEFTGKPFTFFSDPDELPIEIYQT